MAATQKDVVLRFVLSQSDFQRVKNGMETLTNLSGRLNGALSAIGVGVSVGALVAFTKNAANAASQQRALAESIGLSVEELSALNYAARQNETTQEALGKAIFKINELLKEGAEAGSKAATILGRYGITSEQIRTGVVGTSEAIRIIADRFNAMPNGIEKSALAAELLGTKLGQQLIPFLNLGSKGLEEFARKGEAAGAILTDKVADAVAKANDKLSALYQTLQTQVLVGLSAFFNLVEANEGDKQLEELSTQIASLTGEMNLLVESQKRADTGGILGALIHTNDAARIAEIRNELVLLRKERDRLKKEQEDRIVGAGQPKGKVPVTPPDDPGARSKRLEAERKEREGLLDTYDKEGQALAKLSTDQQRLHELAVAGKITWEEYSRAIEGVGEAYSELGASEIPEASGAMNVFAEQAARNIQDITANLLRGKTAGENFFSSMISGLADLAAQLAAQQLLTMLFNSFGSNAAGVGFGTLLFGAASGGYISGPGGPTEDKIPALLSNGEYVINAAAVAKVGRGFLDALNFGVPVRDRSVRMTYATGGMVGDVSHAKRSGAATTIQVQNNIDARGADPASAANVLRAAQEIGKQTEARVYESIRRGYAPTR